MTDKKKKSEGRQYHCGWCNIDFYANPRSVMRKEKSTKLALTEPVKCPQCFNFLPVNPDKPNGSKRKDRSNYKGAYKGG